VPELAEPVHALQDISHDPSLTCTVRLTDGRLVTALDLQEMYYEAAVSASAGGCDEQTRDVLDRWGALIGVLRRDPMDAAASVDWVAKLKILQAYRDRDSVGWDHPRLALVDLQYADLRPGKGIYHRLAQRGEVELLVSQAQVERAVAEPPLDTRAYFRGRCIASFPAEVVGASWDSIIFELPSSNRLQRVQTREPLRGTARLTERLFEESADAEDFLTRLLSGPEPRVAP
jgi:proteasome accessory factor A